MRMTHLGSDGPQVSVLGLGSARITMAGPDQGAESVAMIEELLDHGINFINTADFYASGESEMLIGRAIKGRREQAVISVKCGAVFSPSGKFLGLDGRPNSVKNFAAYSLKRLGIDEIDLFQIGRADPAVPYTDTIGAIADLIQEGKVRYLGVSEVGAANLRLAHSVHPVSALEIEYSLGCRFIEREILPTARELGVAIVAYRVLADGLLSGAVSEDSIGEGHHFVPPRLEGNDLRHNVGVARSLGEMAVVKGRTPAQLAVAWLLTRGDDIVPLVGMRSRARIAENLAVLDISFTADELATLDRVFADGAIQGDRYPAFVQKFAAQ